MTVLIETLKLLSDMAVQGIEPRTTQVIIFEWKFPIFEYHAWVDSQNPSYLLESSFHTKTTIYLSSAIYEDSNNINTYPPKIYTWIETKHDWYINSPSPRICTNTDHPNFVLKAFFIQNDTWRNDMVHGIKTYLQNHWANNHSSSLMSKCKGLYLHSNKEMRQHSEIHPCLQRPIKYGNLFTFCMYRSPWFLFSINISQDIGSLEHHRCLCI